MQPIHRTTSAMGFILFLGLLSCSETFEPPSYLSDLRVLAILASPRPASPGEEITVRAVLYVPPGETVTEERWTFCPFSAGAASGYICLDPSCEVEVEASADGSVRTKPHELALACLARFENQLLDGLPTTIPSTVEVLFRYRVATSSGQRREALLRYPLATAPNAAPKQRDPVIREVQFDGTPLAPGHRTPPVATEGELEVTVDIDPDSLERYQDEAGRERRETPVVSFFSTAGRFEANKAEGETATLRWKAEKLSATDEEAAIWIVVRDLRGGQAVAGPFLIPLIR
ncbi:MAG: hypothetical protein A2284_01365 [Deltaproteobacteria bacterium RIFOXYA12_FULL_61_11]|nr:MAG: hypothetical protein A2284_01365 [Deltaproteobacteria bacterium RIFOXYA12_FULL_61_11]